MTDGGGAETPNIAALPAIARLGAPVNRREVPTPIGALSHCVNRHGVQTRIGTRSH